MGGVIQIAMANTLSTGACKAVKWFFGRGNRLGEGGGDGNLARRYDMLEGRETGARGGKRAMAGIAEAALKGFEKPEK